MQIHPLSSSAGLHRRPYLFWLVLIVFTSAATAQQPPSVTQLPTGGRVIAGQVGIQQDGATLNVTQSTARGVVDWSTFNVGSQAQVNFIQPSASAVTLNRVLDSNPSQIFGRITATGQVFLTNPSGIYFSPTSTADVGGLVATTMGMSASDFMAGGTRFKSSNGLGLVSNQGRLTAGDGGYIALLAPQVRNEGVVIARLGTVALASGNAVTLQFNDRSLVKVEVDEGAINGLIENKSLVKADGGLVVMSAKAANNFAESVIQNTGTVQAQTVEKKAGRIFLLGDMTSGKVNVDGVLDASAPTQGDGGFVETSAARVKVSNSAVVTTKAEQGKTGKWLVDPHDYTVAASGGDQTGANLSTNLENGNIELQSAGGGALGTGDININDAVTWNANHTLTLTASNNVNVNANVTLNGTNAGLIISPNTSHQTEVMSGMGSFNLYKNVAINIPNTSATLSINGHNYLIVNVLGNQGSNSDGTLQGLRAGFSYVALGQDIDGTGTNVWNILTGAPGFTPFEIRGVLDGLGHKVKNVTVDHNPDAGVGFFSTIRSGGVLRNFGLEVQWINGNSDVGGITPYNYGLIENSYISGQVTSHRNVGGMVAYNYGTIKNSWSSAHVSSYYQYCLCWGNTESMYIPAGIASGIAGVNETTGVIQGSYFDGTVYNQSGGVNPVLAGVAGVNKGLIDQVFVSGRVSESNIFGGLIAAVNYGNISNAYANGRLEGTAAGTESFLGGLVADNRSTGSLENSYFSGTIDTYPGLAYGAVVGRNSGVLKNNFWLDSTASAGLYSGVGSAQRINSTELKSKSTFTEATVANNLVNPSWNMSNIWTIYEGLTNPLLTVFLRPISVKINNATVEYSGSSLSGGSYSVISALPSGVTLSGAISYYSVNNSSGVGSYAVSAQGLRSSDYDNQINGSYIKYLEGNWQVIPKNIQIAGISATNKFYDGSTSANLVGLPTANFIAGDNVSITGTGTGNFFDKNAGTNKSVTVSGYTLGGTDASNYNLIQPTGLSANISASPLTLTAVTDNKAYNASIASSLMPNVTGLQGIDTVTGISQVFDSKNAGNRTLSVHGYTINDGNNGNNYSVTTQTANGAITATSLLVTGVIAQNKIYDTTTTATLSGTAAVTPLANDDVNVSGVGVGVFADKNVDANKSVTISGFTLGGTDASNYNIVQPMGLTGSITPAPLTATASQVTKPYDGTLHANGIGIVSGLIGSDSVNSAGTQQYLDKNASVGNKTVQASGITIKDSTGSDVSGNYLISYVDNSTSTITPAPLTLTAFADTKIYDTSRMSSQAPTVTGLQSGDAVSGITQVFDSKNAGNRVLSVSGYTVSDGNSGNNYTVTTATANGTITPAPLVVSAVTDSKVYEATTTSAQTPIVSGLQSGDMVSGVTQVFDSKNAGNRILSVSGYTVSDGNSGDNYTVTTTTANGTITPANLQSSGIGAENKIYDTSTRANLKGTATVTPISGDYVSVAGKSVGRFADKLVGVNKSVTVTGFVLTGADANNYRLLQPIGVTASIVATDERLGMPNSQSTYPVSNLGNFSRATTLGQGVAVDISVSKPTESLMVNLNLLEMLRSNFIDSDDVKVSSLDGDSLPSGLSFDQRTKQMVISPSAQNKSINLVFSNGDHSIRANIYFR